MVPIAIGDDPRLLCPHQRFTRNPGRQFPILVIDDPDLVEVLDQAPTGPVVDQIEARSQRAVHLRATPGRRDHAVEAGLELLGLRYQRHHQHPFERVVRIILGRILAVQKVGHGAKQKGCRGIVPPHVPPEASGTEGAGQHRRRAGDAGGVHQCELAGDVEQRQGCVVDVAFVQIEHPDDALGILIGMRVGDGGALGGSGGAGGVHHRHEIDMTRPLSRPFPVGRRQFAPVDQLGIGVDRMVRRSDDTNPFQGVEIVCNGLDPFQVLRVHHQDFCLRIVDQVGENRAAVVDVHRYFDGPDLRKCTPQADVVDGIGQHEQDGVAGRDAGLGEAPRQPAGAGADVTVAVGTVVGHKPRLVGRARHPL